MARQRRVPARGRSTRSQGTQLVLETIRRFFARAWSREPRDIAALRSSNRPPMGTLPCVVYANFNTFWLGESLQVLRELGRERAIPEAELARMAAALLDRHAARLQKWKVSQTVRLLKQVSDYFREGGATTHDEFVEVVEALLLAVDRINAWIDATIPWSRFDRQLRLHPPAR